MNSQTLFSHEEKVVCMLILDKKSIGGYMNRRSIFAISTLAAVLLVGGGAAWAMNSSQSASETVPPPASSSSSSKAKEPRKELTVTPSTTSAPEPPVDEVPSSGAVPSPEHETAPQVPQEEYEAIDTATRQWSDARGNIYEGPNAISCGDGSAPVTIGHGMPAQCAFSSDNAEPPVLVE